MTERVINIGFDKIGDTFFIQTETDYRDPQPYQKFFGVTHREQKIISIFELPEMPCKKHHKNCNPFNVNTSSVCEANSVPIDYDGINTYCYCKAGTYKKSLPSTYINN